MSQLLIVSLPRLTILLAAATLSGSACASDDAGTRRDSIVAASEEAYAASHKSSAPPDTAAASAVRATVAVTDNNILARLAQGDRMELQAAKIAVGKATSAQLRAFARELADNHSSAENDARKLSQRLKIPEQPATNDTTKAQQQTLAAQLNKLPKGATFDTTYVRHVVDGHVAMIKDARAMEGQATDAEVKKLVQGVIPELERHLARARVIGKALTAAKPTAAKK